MATVAIQQQDQKMSGGIVVLSWVLRLVAAVILLQTLFFKFTAASESVYIFTRLASFLSAMVTPVLGAKIGATLAGSEAAFRIGSGVMELAAAVLLLWPRYPWAGAVLALAATGGAIVSHLTFLGIDVQGDHGLLFGLAITVVACSLSILAIYRSHLPFIGGLFR